MNRFIKVVIFTGALMFINLASGGRVVIAAPGTLPQVIADGLSAYKDGGPEAAIAGWVKGSAFENDKKVADQAFVLKQIQEIYGEYVGYDVIDIKQLTPSSRIIYLQINFTEGPLFIRFLAYLKQNNWVLSGTFNFNTDYQLVIPWDLLKDK